MPYIGDLPLEILEYIASSISLGDITTCLLVNHKWHNVFERVLYQSVDTRQRVMFLVFMQRLKSTSQSALPLGHCVRELKVCDGLMTSKQMNQLMQLCPYVSSLTFRWQDNKAHEAHIANTMSGYSRRYFGTPERILEMFPRITRLTLNCEPRSRRNRATFHVKDASLYLKGTQNLRYLALHGVLRKMTYRHMDMIHEACPNLAHLRITIGTSEYASYVDILNTPNEATAESDERIRNLDGPHWPAPTRMQCLEVRDESILLDMERWIRYVAAMYPRLRELLFSNWCWERAMKWLQNDKPQSWRYDDDRGLLAERCPELHTVEFSDVSLPKEAMCQIFSGSELSKVTIKGECMNLVDEEGYKKMADLVARKVRRLELALPIKHIGEPFTNAAICDHLVELQLMCSGVLNELVQVRIDCVLQRCPVLTDLTLEGVNGKASLTSHLDSPLTTLRLRSVDLRCGSLLRFVSRSCPRLLHLHMYQCIGSSFRPASGFTLDFVSHHLKSLCIYHHMPKRVAMSRVKLFSLHTRNDRTLCDMYLVPDIAPLLRNLRSLNFDEGAVTGPDPPGKFIKLNNQQALDLLEFDKPSLGKRKRPGLPSTDVLLQRCKFELDGGGCISLRCASVAKVIVNGTYLVRNGTCLR